jgi:hypothetical protein
MSDSHQTLDLERVRRELHLLHDRIARSWGRIEITSSDGSLDNCVLISKAELETMERALEILCELPGGKQICEGITRVADVSVRHFADAYEAPRVTALYAGPDSAGSNAML